MSKKFLIPALLAAAVSAVSMPAFAQERGYHNDATNRYDARDERNEARDMGRDQRGDRMQADRRNDQWRGDRRDERRDYRRGDRDDGRAEGGWGRTESFHSGYDGYGPDHNLRRGERLPSRYRNHQYVVDNWRAHHLSAPPRGHHWVQVGADYVLVAAATGLIVQAVMGQ